MKYAETRPYADPEKAARKLLEIANSVELLTLDNPLIAKPSTRIESLLCRRTAHSNAISERSF